MQKTAIAKLYRRGRDQLVRLPPDFHLPGKTARVRRVGKGVLLEPIPMDVKAWFAAMDRHKAPPLLARGRRQPKTPVRDDID